MAEYSVHLVHDPDMSDQVRRGAVKNLNFQYLEASWGVHTITGTDGRDLEVPELRLPAEYLSNAELAELEALALAPKTPLSIRVALINEFVLLAKYSQWRPYRFDMKAFPALLRDRSQRYDVKRSVFYLLDEIGGDSVKRVFKEIIAQKGFRSVGENGLLVDLIESSRVLEKNP